MAILLKKIMHYWDLGVILAFFWIVIITLLIQSLSLNDGNLVYSLDDAYIHMAVAKNFYKFGIWGINSDSFASCTSSIFYPFLLSFTYLIFGVNDWIPLILNLICSNLIILFTYYILKKKYNLFSPVVIGAEIILILFTPLTYLNFTGMEHILHILVIIVIFYYSFTLLVKNDQKSNKKFSKEEIYLLFLIPLITAIRFESIALILVLTFLFFIRKKYLFSIFIVVLGLLPIMIYGVISLSNGWFFLPNSVVLKGATPNFDSLENIVYSLGYNGFKNLMSAPHLLLLLIGASIILFNYSYLKKKVWSEQSIMSIIFIVIALFQLQYAETGLISRSDAYLTFLGIFLIIISLREQIISIFPILTKQRKLDMNVIKENLKIENLIRNLSLIVLILLISFPFLYRAFIPLSTNGQATHNIYDQQFQMGRFLHEYYQGEVVAANDIGAINYYSDIECLDLWGLANMQVALAKMSHTYNNETIEQLAEENNCKIAIIYDSWFFSYGIPADWIKVGQWTIQNNVVCGSDTISFYAVDPLEESTLITHLQDFSNQLPNDVIESGLYTE